MGLLRRFAKKRETMPRVRPEVEQNKVQRPELVRALQQRMGTRQSHIVPTMGSELLPVIVVDDLTQQSVRPEKWCAQFKSQVNAGANPNNWYLFNPLDSGVLCKPKRFMLSPPHGNILNMVINNIATPIAPITRKGGRLLVGGQAGAGIPGDFPTQFTTACSLWSGEVGGVPGVTFWEQYLPDGITAPASQPLFEMDLPKILIYPGSALIWFQDASPVGTDTELYVEWTEENLT